MKSMTLAFAGLEPDDLTDFRRVFGKLRSQLSADWRLVDDADADLTVVDIDSIYGHMDWLKLTGSGMRAAVYTSAQYAKESDLVLVKPLKADNLAEILNAAAAEPEHGESEDDSPAEKKLPPEKTVAEPAQAADSATRKPAAAPAPATKEPQPVKAGVARQIRAEKKPRSVPRPAAATQPGPAVSPQPKTEPGPGPKSEPVPESRAEPESAADVRESTGTIGNWLVRGYFGEPVRIAAGDDNWIVDPDREAYYGPATLKPLGKVLDAPVSELVPVDVTVLERMRKGQAQPLARLRWYAGLMSSPGKLSPSLQGSTRFGLSRWPQIEREFPRHFRIATAMMKQAGSVAELSAASGAPEAEVADFVNASHAVDMVEHDGAATKSQARGRGISRLRGR